MSATPQRISGDTEDLPAGWFVDEDNWGSRELREGDQQRLEGSPRHVFMRTCITTGMVCVHTAEAARYMDGESE